jgi:zinc protease
MRISSKLAGLLVAATAPLAAQKASPIRALPYTRFVLPNGLTVILNEDHATPLAAVEVYYKFGARDDTPGRAGIAHLCEHIMGEGSPNLDQPQSNFYRTLGGTSIRSAETGADVTNYYVMIPSHQLETVLWAEGDRLANALSKADSQTIAAVRPVVAQERLQSFDNVPLFAGPYREAVEQALYPEAHPYRMSAMNPMPDLPRLGPAEVRASCGPAYVPNNAVLAVSGDFNSATAKRWVEKYFGFIPRGAPFKRVPAPPVPLTTEKRLVQEDSRMTVPQLRMAWRGAGYSDPDRLALIAFATALSPSRISADGHLGSVGVEPAQSLGRLSKVLVQDRQLATRVVVDNYDFETGGIFEVAVYPRPNTSLTTIETVVDSVLASFDSSPITPQEIQVYNNYNAVHLATALEPRYMRADTLAHDEVFAGDPSAYAKQANYARTLKPADIDRVRKKFFGAGRVVLSLVPAGKLDLVSKPTLPFANVTPAKAGK